MAQPTNPSVEEVFRATATHRLVSDIRQAVRGAFGFYGLDDPTAEESLITRICDLETAFSRREGILIPTSTP